MSYRDAGRDVAIRIGSRVVEVPVEPSIVTVVPIPTEVREVRRIDIAIVGPKRTAKPAVVPTSLMGLGFFLES